MTVATEGIGGSADAVAPVDATVVSASRLVVDGLGPVDLALRRGEVTIVVSRPSNDGPALMSGIAGLRAPTSGRVVIAGHDLTALALDDARRARYELVGYVLRDIGLDPELTVAQNIAAPIGLAGRASSRGDAEWLARLAQSFGVVSALDRRAGALDTGMQQRVAVARALATQPALVYAEEPIARLDPRDGRVVLALLRTITHEYGIALVIATQDHRIVAPCDRVIAVRDGRIVGDRRGDDMGWVAAFLDDNSQASTAPAPYDHPRG